MGFGIEIYSPSGALVANLDSRLPRIIGQVSTGLSNGSLTNSQFANGTPYAIPLFPSSNAARVVIEITFSGTTMSWTFPDAAPTTAITLLYGYY